MQMKRSIKLFCTVLSIFFLGIGGIVSGAQASSITYPSDGIWEDTFKDNRSVNLTYCVVKNNEIVLAQEISNISYNFNQSNHKAYAYQSFFFFPIGNFFSPKTHLFREIEFGRNDIIRIQDVDNDYANRSSSSIQRYVVHHFRFQIDLSAETISTINMTWSGKTYANAVIKFYYWNASGYLKGGWQKLETYRSDGKDTSEKLTIPGGAAKYAFDADNYLDICIVAYFPLLFRPCTLSTDYIGLLTKTTKGYIRDKTAIAKTKDAIDPKNISKYTSFYWESLCWDDSQPSGTDIRYHILYLNQTGKYDFVEDSVLPYNRRGFNQSPVFLNLLSNHEYGTKYNKLKIQANLSTDSPSVSPRIFSWALTWQNKTLWHDSFNTFYRIDDQARITQENGTIMISLIQDEWPLFGFDSGNTRASDCIGATTNNLYWFSREYVGGGLRNPVIGDGKVYIVSNGRILYQYNVILSSGLTEGDPQVSIASVKVPYDVVNSPAVTDELVIVATGAQATGGASNRIYAYETDNLTLKWQYPEPPNVDKICYDASPVVVGDMLFISTWGGDNGVYLNEKNRYTNNKLLAIELKTGQKRWEYSLPAPSYATPAVTADMIIVACSSTDNQSIIALSHTGEKVWGKALGAVDHASPVIYQDKVFVTCKQVSNKKTATRIVAMNLNDGAMKWNATLSELATCYDNIADSTPAVYDGVLYAASPDGKVYAINIENGTTLWTPSQVYSIPLLSCDVLRSSPAYADSHVYIGTPEGKVFAINTTTGGTTWEFETFWDYSKPNWMPAPVLGSPVVSNGLVFFTDENGVLYSLGKFTASTKEVTGRIISLPIRLPESLWWNSFYALTRYDSSVSSIKFKLLDEGGTVIKDGLTNGSILTSGDKTLGRTLRLQADFSAKNITKDNPKLFDWYITLKADTQKPFLDGSSFTPDPKGWLQEIVPVFTIKVKDNITGLRVKSAWYTLEYVLDNVSKKTTVAASCTGQNGTTEWQLLTMNISALSFFENITKLQSLVFNISDLAGNTAEKKVTFKQDVKKPTSYVLADTMKKKYNSSYVLINAKANDTGTLNVDASGIDRVELYYRYSQTNVFSDDWIFFADSPTSLPSWKFNFTTRPNQNGGYFELCTIAIDNASNVEDFPLKGDVSFVYDWKAPQLPSVSGDTLWFNERPQFSVIFRDDFLLDTIQYRPNFDSIWTTIASRVNASVYNTDAIGHSWSLKQEYWDMMIEDEVYYLYFKINDTLGNALLATGTTDAIIIRKDMFAPIVNIDIPDVTTEWTWADNFTVSGIVNDRNGSGVKEAYLYYRFSKDTSNWSSWIPFGDPLDSSPFEWNFKATEGDGHYQIKVNVVDYAGNAEESEVVSVSVASFPTELALVLVGLVVVLVIIIMIIIIIWRKRE
ncbi:MAG: hypothetical protein BV458_05470 [Thermoplasmata archaeon M9B2D]|nr:MAG: hypothetical protein BV458_05470 [Thermoplasmata archaeon M9B2D]